MTTINEYLNRDTEDKGEPITTLEDAKKAYPEVATWAETDEEILAALEQKP